jgi:peptide/nickel transport system permease protein
VVFGHAMRSAMTPVVSQLGIDVGTLLGGVVVVVESVFGIGGIGQDSVEAIDQGNLPLIIGFVLAAAVFVIVANILVDIAYALLTPASGSPEPFPQPFLPCQAFGAIVDFE